MVDGAGEGGIGSVLIRFDYPKHLDRTVYSPVALRQDLDNVIGLKINDIDYRIILEDQTVIFIQQKLARKIPITKDTKILITADQNGRGSKGSVAELYIDRPTGILLALEIALKEPISNLRGTVAYKIIEDIATTIAAHYQISWEYKISVDTPEKVTFQKIMIVAVAVFLICWMAFAIYGIKYATK